MTGLQEQNIVFSTMRFHTRAFLLLSTVVAPTLATLITHNLRSRDLEGQQQLSLYDNTRENQYLGNSPVLVLAITTKEIRDDAKATQHAAVHGKFFGEVNKANDRWTLYYVKYDPKQHLQSQAG